MPSTTARVTVCSVAKVEPAPVPTVSVETPPFSAMPAGCAVNTSTGAASSSSMVTVRRVPKPAPARMPSIRMVSASSSMMSSTPVNVVSTVEAARPTPAGSVSVESTE